jgi:flagellar protein FlaJ
MSSAPSSLALEEKASPKKKAKAEPKPASAEDRGGFKLLGKYDLDDIFSREPLDFDLLAQLTHMSAVATSGMARSQLFEGTAGLSYSTSRYFRQVHLIAQRLGYDYSRACEVVADEIDAEGPRSLLLHFATSLSSGEQEAQFLLREAALQRETYGKEYGRKIESLQKWSDAYVALMVSATLVVVISIVSMMIYPFSPIAILGLSVLMTFVTFIGGWLVFTVAPIEVKTHSLRQGSPEQERAGRLARVLLPSAALAGFGAGLLFGLPFGMAAAALLIAPVGIIAFIDDRKLDQRDRDISIFVRALGGVMAAAGITAADALGRLNRRSLGSLEPLVARLYVRLRNGISPDLCWLRLAAESGSEVVTRTVRIFWDGIRSGGDVEKVSTLASEFSLKIWLLRADRKLVSTTFSWLAVPLHAVLIGILLFVTEVVQVFSRELSSIEAESLQDSDLIAQAGVSNAILLSFSGVEFLPIFVGTIAVFLTAANSFAPYAATGGHRLKLCLYAAIMLLICALAFLTVPAVVHGLFSNIADTPSTGQPVVIPTTEPIGGTF